MTTLLGPDDITGISPAGHYIALRIGFAFPIEEINALPEKWVELYTAQRYMLFDPVIRWVYSHNGATRWSEIDLDDPRKILPQAQTYGMRYGVAVACIDSENAGQRSFGSFARSDREFNDLEIRLLQAYILRRHSEMAPPQNLTNAELEALGMIRDGLRLKQIAHRLGVSEGAVKQRLKNAKQKLDAKTGPQAAALAAQYGLI